MVRKTLIGMTLLAVAGCDGTLDKLTKPLEGGKAVIKTRVTVASKAQAAPAQVGTNAADGLLSMKYYIKNLGICKTAEVQGTGFNMGPECIVLYEAESDSDYEPADPTSLPSPDDYIRFVEAARADDSSNFIDLMSATSREQMNRTIELTEQNIGEYHYGYVYWYAPIKFSAQMTLSDGSVIYSHDGTTATIVDQNNVFHLNTISSASFVTGPAEEAVVANQNGGTWFRFQAPFTVTENDLAAGTQFQLKLAFNPEGVVRGAGPNSGGGLQLRDSAYGAPGYSFEVPILDLSPVVHREGETAQRESYLFAVSTPTGNQFDVRYDLYFVRERPGTILAVETKALAKAASTAGPTAYTVSFVETAADGTITFLKWDSKPILSGFKRAAQAGDAVTATLHCEDGPGLPGYWCDAATMTNGVSGSLVGVYTLE